jgi:hypothetical protein
MSVSCRHRLPSPDIAGAQSWDKLKEWAAAYPHLRPCPMYKGSSGGWAWVYRKDCVGCPDAVKEGRA